MTVETAAVWNMARMCTVKLNLMHPFSGYKY